jgi:4-diphosphocytidyl-2-C-methyl-D-erythritol kinase
MLEAGAAVAETAPAKINLALHVTGQRADGYHLLESLVVFTDFGDRVAVSPAERDVVELGGQFNAGLAVDGGNLVVRARQALRATLSANNPTSTSRSFAPGTQIGPVRIHLEKNLPIASGIGGGSSDAAATLVALNRLWNAGLTKAQLAEIGLPLGADVPMCLVRRPLIARGIGERVEAIARFPALPIVLANPGVGISTPRIFAEMASRKNTPLPALPSEASFDRLLEWLGQTRNDLMAPALSLEPVIGEALHLLTAQNAAFVRMSGSGATCFGLFADLEAARRAAAAIHAAQPDWFVVATMTGGTRVTDSNEAGHVR